MKEPYRLLLVDDNTDDIADFRQMLLRGSARRYEFVEAHLGSVALQKVRDTRQARIAGADDDTALYPFDCILLDFQLPDMNAHEVLAALRGSAELPPCPVVVVTGWKGAGNDDGSRLLRAGAQDYIGKSWTSPESLTRAIENATDRYALLSQRQHMRTQLHEADERYRLLFNAADECLCVLEKVESTAEQPIDFRFVDLNPAFRSQCGMAGEIGATIRQLVPDAPDDWFADYDRVCSSGLPLHLERDTLTQGRVLELRVFRITSAGSCQIAIFFNDITERKTLERQLREHADALAELDRRKNEFLAVLSHELRNPLAPIFNALHLLRLQKDEAPIPRKARNIIERQVAQLNHLVDDLLEISRINTGSVRLRIEQIALDSVIERAVETVHPLMLQRGHELIVSAPEGPVWLRADPARLEQVVVNLLTNAAKYTDEGGRITLMTSQEGEGVSAEVVLRVRDTGIGIAPDVLPRIFDLFTQAERSLDRSQGGLGIGLCLVQRMVSLHGGQVEAHSVPGQGSEFVVRLPGLQAAALMPALQGETREDETPPATAGPESPAAL
ncbi:MAG: hybrid sensor histidine kinase/response regulator [Polaromonas sp.]|nr:hybrid sensor histidine kinase/response regulator [Polaromonas sp.]